MSKCHSSSEFYLKVFQFQFSIYFVLCDTIVIKRETKIDGGTWYKILKTNFLTLKFG